VGPQSCAIHNLKAEIERGIITRSPMLGVEMWDEIFKFESFINFMNFFEIFQDPLFEIFIEILYFNYNSPITRKNASKVVQQLKASGWKSRVMVYLPLFCHLLVVITTRSSPRPTNMSQLHYHVGAF